MPAACPMRSVPASPSGIIDMTTGQMRTKSAERGAASIAIAIVILLIITAALFASQTLTSSIAQDATASDQRVQALFLAETGLERATQRFTKGALCSSASDETVTVTGTGTGSFQLQFIGASSFDGTACSASVCGSTYCRVRSTGRVLAGTPATAVNARTIEALVIPKSLTATGTKNVGNPQSVGGHQRYTLSNTVSSGTNQIYILTILWSTTPSKSGKVTGVIYNGAPIPAMISLVPTAVFPANASAFYAQIYYVKDPPAGTSDVYVDFDALPDGLAVGGLNADGVDQTTPIVGYGPFGGGATTYSTLFNSINLPPNALAIDVLSRDNGGNASFKPCTDPLDATVGMISIYTSNANKVAGETSYCGPVSSGGLASFSMGYTFGSAKASYAQAVIRPDNSATGGKRVRLGGSAGVVAWHELIATPP